MTTARLLYVTTPTREEARSLANELLSRRLIACANLLPQMESIYRWKGNIESANECVLLLKTDAALVADVTQAIESLHSYEVPCVLELPIESGSLPYLNWIHSETKPQS